MTNRQFTWAVSAALVLLGFLAYANTFSGDWVWDDVSSVLLHENVQNPAKLGQLFREDQHAFGKGEGNFYRPLVSVSFMVDFLLSYDPVLDGAELKGYPDVKPFLFHISNTLWHCAAAVLIFLLLGRLGAPRLVRSAAAVLFVLHPMHTEAVAYISGRADMMSATFILAALLCATTDAQGGRRWAAIAFSGIFFTLGLCSKESTMIYPVLLAVVIALRPASPDTEANKAPWLLRAQPLILAAVILGIYGVLRATVLKFGSGGGSNDTGLTARLVETCQAFAFYIKTLFIPTGLHMEQTLNGVPVWTAALGLLFLSACAGAAVWGYRSGNRRITLGIVWFLAAWLPISGIFPLNAPMAEHWMYVPMVGFWWAFLEVMLPLARRGAVRPLALGALVLLGLTFLHLTITRNADWKNNETIFRATLARNPNTLRVHTNLAVTYDFLQGNYPGAVRHYEAVLASYQAQKTNPDTLIPDEIGTRLSLAEVLLRQQKYNEALQWYGSLMPLTQQESMKADGAKAAFGVGQCYLGLGDFARASQLMQQAVSLDPTLGGQYVNARRGAPSPARAEPSIIELWKDHNIMLKHTLIHPGILEAIGAAGHGSRILIADGNYPASTKCGLNTERVYLNLKPGMPTVTEVLDVLLTAIPVEGAAVMTPPDGPEPTIFAEFRQRLTGLELEHLGRLPFYEEASGDDTCLTIITGEQRIYANLLLTVGVRMPD